jgi:hypothetical protein
MKTSTVRWQKSLCRRHNLNFEYGEIGISNVANERCPEGESLFGSIAGERLTRQQLG